MEILSTTSSNQMPRIPATSAFGRGCVKTHRADAPSNIDLSERSVFDYFSLRKGKRTPETETALRFYTASFVSGHELRQLSKGDHIPRERDVRAQFRRTLRPFHAVAP